jgi:hypothetical protein
MTCALRAREEPFGGVRAGRQEADIVDAHEVGAVDAFDGASVGVVDAVAAHEAAEVFEREPHHPQVAVDGGLPERFEEVALAGAAGAAEDEVLPPLDPLQRP